MCVCEREREGVMYLAWGTDCFPRMFHLFYGHPADCVYDLMCLCKRGLNPFYLTLRAFDMLSFISILLKITRPRQTLFHLHSTRLACAKIVISKGKLSTGLNVDWMTVRQQITSIYVFCQALLGIINKLYQWWIFIIAGRYKWKLANFAMFPNLMDIF